ncbi:MAG TPA: FAD-binding oxidoreductase [Croceibacterium sp.]|nr:FAD-binding oxidoreductase [Croceibacterium sp.]
MDSDSLKSLEAHVTRIVSAGGAGFDAARDRAVWNKRLTRARSPLAIVTARTAEEAAETIRFAIRNGLTVSPRGGGHNYQASVLRDRGIMLDLSGLDMIEIDAAAGTARVGVGVEGGALSERLAQAGFAFPVGHCVDVALSGYLIGGGFGWNAGEWGAACANVETIEMIRADGRIVIASPEEHAELFWAARGAGPGFFAAVTAFHLKLHPLPPTAYAWRAAFAASSAPVLADWLTAATATAPPQTEVGCFLFAHWDTGEHAVVLRVSACGDNEAAAREKVSAFTSPPPSARMIGHAKGEALPYTGLFKLSPMPSGKRVAADHLWSDASIGDLLLTVYELPAPSSDSTIDIVAFGGHTPVALPQDAALSISAGAGVGIYGLWDDPADDEANRAWVRRVDEALAPFRTGRYVAEADLTAGPARRAECFTPAALARQQELRGRYDPNGLFPAWP